MLLKKVTRSAVANRSLRYVEIDRAGFNTCRFNNAVFCNIASRAVAARLFAEVHIQKNSSGQAGAVATCLAIASTCSSSVPQHPPNTLSCGNSIFKRL
jgi:hypothetical protein